MSMEEVYFAENNIPIRISHSDQFLRLIKLNKVGLNELLLQRKKMCALKIKSTKQFHTNFIWRNT